jgi:4-amino-4-deoxy-L-arabinose transferase-like glycosyltransferase
MRDPFFAAVAAGFTLLALGWGLMLPAFESVDEQNHYRYMVFLKDHGRLPRQLPSPAESTGEGHQPPLYYALGALALRIFQPDARFQELPRAATAFNREPVYFVHGPEESFFNFEGQAFSLHLLRLIQLFALIVPGLLCLAWALSRLLPRTEARLAFGVLALNPGFIALAGALNNDHGAWVLGTAALAVLLLGLEHGGASWWEWLLFGVLAGLAGMAKPTALGILAAGLFMALSRPTELKRRGPWLALAAVAAATGWWFLRNALLYGDATAWNALVADCPQCVHPKPCLLWAWWWFWISRTFETFWSVFGWMTWRASPWVTLGFWGLTTAALIGLVSGRARALKSGVAALAWAAFLGVSIVVLRHDLALDPPAGRYFYAAILPIGLLLGQGWSVFKAPAWTPWVLGGALAVLDLWLLFGRMVPLYAPAR